MGSNRLKHYGRQFYAYVHAEILFLEPLVSATKQVSNKKSGDISRIPD
jgi:hypothetical protein